MSYRRAVKVTRTFNQHCYQRRPLKAIEHGIHISVWLSCCSQSGAMRSGQWYAFLLLSMNKLNQTKPSICQYLSYLVASKVLFSFIHLFPNSKLQWKAVEVIYKTINLIYYSWTCLNALHCVFVKIQENGFQQFKISLLRTMLANNFVVLNKPMTSANVNI